MSNSAREVRRNLVSLTLYNIPRGFATGAYQTLFGMYASSLGYSMSQLGGIVSIGSAIGAFTGPLVGYLIDVYGSRIIIILTGLMLAASLATLYVGDSLPMLIASYSLFMLAFYYGQPARMSFLATSVGLRSLGRSIGLTSTTFSGSRVAGPALGGLLVTAFSYRDVFLAISLGVIAGTLYFTLASFEPLRERGRASLREAVRSYMLIVKPNRVQRRVFIFAGMDRVAWSLWFPLLSAHLYSSGYEESIVGVLVSLIHITQTISLPITGRLTDRIGSRINLAVSELVGASGTALLIFSHNIYVAPISMVFIGLSLGFWIPSYNKIIAEVATHIGETYAAANTVRSITSIPTPYIGGYIYSALASTYTFALSAFLLASLSLYILHMGRGDR